MSQESAPHLYHSRPEKVLYQEQAREGSVPSKKRVPSEDGTTSTEEMTIEGSGQKVYKMDLRGASVTFNMS